MLYVGANDAKLFISKNATTPLVWDVCHTPIERYALTTYHSQLVLVGGWKPSVLEPTNKLWTLSSDAGMNWQPSIQEMPTKRWGASAMNTGTPEYLVVAGGVGIYDSALDKVEVFTGKKWCTVEPLPELHFYLKWALHKGKYYLCGGYPTNSAVYCCDIKSILKSCEQSGVNTTPFPLWSQFPVPSEFSSLVSFGQNLISIAYNSSPDVVALSPLNQSWVHVGKLPVALDSAASIVLPTGELLVIGGISLYSSVLKATLRGEDNYAQLQMTSTSMYTCGDVHV